MPPKPIVKAPIKVPRGGKDIKITDKVESDNDSENSRSSDSNEDNKIGKMEDKES